MLVIGAGSGQLSALIRTRVGLTIAVEPAPAMRAKSTADPPDVDVLGGVAKVIPLHDGAIDAIVVGDAFHWFNPSTALPGIARLAAEISRMDVRSSVQLNHGGMRAVPEVSGRPTVAPWDDPETGARALTTDEVQQAVEDFAAAAVRAEQAGFDGIEVHGAHGYLVGQFLDATHSRREDGYGGDAAGRARFLREAVQEIRSRAGWPRDRARSCRPHLEGRGRAMGAGPGPRPDVRRQSRDLGPPVRAERDRGPLLPGTRVPRLARSSPCREAR